jgi:hypothetical protein
VGHHEQHCVDNLTANELDSDEPDYLAIEEPDLGVVEWVDLA